MLLQHRESKLIKIETYWNVNGKMTKEEIMEIKIKIETYWNVNCVRKLENQFGRILK